MDRMRADDELDLETAGGYIRVFPSVPEGVNQDTSRPPAPLRKNDGLNPELLIDSIVRQTMVLIAEIATATDSRPQLARTADDIFRSLTTALRDQGITNKAIADMFGLTLRTYHNRVARLAETDAQRGQQLRDALLEFIEQEKSVRKAQVIDHFRAHEPVLVVGLLRDLVSAELVFQSGSGHAMAYRIARSDELPPRPADDDQRLSRLMWIAIQRFGPVSLESLLKLVPASPDAARRAVDGLIAEGKVTANESDGRTSYSSDECFIPPEDPTSWEAAVFDHFHLDLTGAPPPDHGHAIASIEPF